MTLVVDASLALSWCLPNEETNRTDALLARVKNDGGSVPAIWPYEVVSVLLKYERNGRIKEADVGRAIELLSGLQLGVDTENTDAAFGVVLDLARRHGLTGYDAAYVELAVRLDLPLGTNDSPMRIASLALGLEVL